MLLLATTIELFFIIGTFIYLKTKNKWYRFPIMLLFVILSVFLVILINSYISMLVTDKYSTQLKVEELVPFKNGSLIISDGTYNAFYLVKTINGIENSQVWKQALSAAYHINKLDDIIVSKSNDGRHYIIYRGPAGGWKIFVLTMPQKPEIRTNIPSNKIIRNIYSE